MTISLTNVSVNDYQLQITIENQTGEVLLIAKNQFDIQVDAESAETATQRYHCGHLKTSITQGIEEYIDQHGSRNFLGRHKYLKLSPSQPYPLNISLTEFKDHPFFHKIEHDFTITIKFDPQVEHLGKQCTPSQFKIRLQWYPMHVHLLTPIISEPSKSTLEPSERGQLMLEYRDTKPFYLNVSESSNLQLWISGNDTKAWTTHEKSQLTLNGSLTVDLENLPENSQFDATLTQQIIQQFKLQSAKVIEHKEGLLLIIPINNPQAIIQQDSHATLKVSLSSSTKPKQSLHCDIPILLQRPCFPGRVTLDFGTTNSAIAYYDPNSGIPNFPERTFSDSQLDKLNKTIEQLMGNISKAVSKNKHYQVVSDQLIQFAKTMWRTDSKGNQVNSVDAIKQHFKYLKRNDEDAVKMGEYQANLLVSWGNIGYNNLKINQAPLEILNFVTQHYLQALDDIIDVDIEKDAHSDLPELDTGQRNGTIPSDIMLRSLEPSATEKTAQGIWKGIDGLRSNIDMGEAVKSSLSDKQENLEQNALLDIPKDDKERHNFYLSGTKRGIGLKDTSYFIDKKNEVFLDTYDPLCVSAIKELLTRTEEHVDKQRSCLNDLVVTYPANLPQYRRETYRNIIHSLGVARVDMSFDEATAGALYYIWRELFKDLFAGIDGFLARSRVKEQVSEHPVTGENRQIKFYYQNILLYDMGGGTTDIALLEIGLEEIENLLSADKANSGRYFVIRPKILGLTGLETFGGDNVTLAVFRILKSKLAATTAKLLLDNENKHNAYSPEIKEALNAFKLGQDNDINIFTHWFSEDGSKNYHEKRDITESSEEAQNAQKRELANLIEALVNTHFTSKLERQPIFFGLWQQAEHIKKVLSTAQLGYEDVPLPKEVSASPPKLFPAIAHLELGISEMDLDNITVSVQEMERLIKSDVEKTFKKARSLCIGKDEKTGNYFTKHTIDHLVLAGSSSHLGLVREKMPFEILGTSPKFDRKGQTYSCAAPFKYDGYNLQFSPNDAKLAVVRGAALPSYFKTTRIPPQADKMRDLLQEGINFLDFDIDNLRNYMPFTLIYPVGTGKTELFESGEQMRDISRNGKPALRRNIPEGDTFALYRVDSLVDRDKSQEQQYYTQFAIRDEFIQFYAAEYGEKLEKNRDKDKLDKLMSQYLFWVEFDIERNMQCFMYTNQDGNDDERFINQTATPMTKQLEEAKKCLVESDGNKEWTFKPNIKLYCPVGVGGKFEEIILRQVSPTEVSGEVIFRQMIEGTGGDTYFHITQDQDSKAIWKVNLQEYKIKNKRTFLEPKLRIRLSLQQGELDLTYSVYDPDLTGENVHEIKMSHDSRKAPPPFNPYRGEE